MKFKNKMNNFIRKKDIENLEQKVHELLIEQRRTRNEISERINGSTSQIIAVIFSESRKIRQEIGYQTLMLKILEDNLSEIQFDEEAGTGTETETGISSRIEVSIGAEIFGTGAKWVLDIGVTKNMNHQIEENG
ncbi:MAG: hypothetical protein OCU20_07010 [Methanophagales archaeon]|nr:hypothetical protein [Methanophagales archaeon]MCW7073619.1 hypothetical protein [Methanophagales archaeon]